MPKYVAITGKNCWVTSVVARDEADARKQIEHQLEKPGRTKILKDWRDGGQRLERIG